MPWRSTRARCGPPETRRSGDTRHDQTVPPPPELEERARAVGRSPLRATADEHAERAAALRHASEGHEHGANGARPNPSRMVDVGAAWAHANACTKDAPRNCSAAQAAVRAPGMLQQHSSRAAITGAMRAMAVAWRKSIGNRPCAIPWPS